MSKTPNHVIWDNSVEGTANPPQLYPAYRFRCRNCGEVYDMAVPCPMRMMSAAMTAFLRDHRRCKPRAEPKTEP